MALLSQVLTALGLLLDSLAMSAASWFAFILLIGMPAFVRMAWACAIHPFTAADGAAWNELLWVWPLCACLVCAACFDFAACFECVEWAACVEWAECIECDAEVWVDDDELRLLELEWVTGISRRSATV